ncbi:YwbE family protein [Bacillus wiedmannii]|uniref:YwbE family protein n=1 Tax=Bacillus wiedmannii TaxID=1890302 RepID=UPI003D198BCB
MLKKLLFFVLLSLCVMSLSACKGDEEKLKVASDEQKIDEDKKVAEEEKRKQEEQQRVEEEKRKQEEQQRVEEKRKQQEQKTQQQQSIQQERTQKQEKTTQATGGKPTRSQISVGSHVVIQLDNDYSKTVSGVVKDILTHSETHTYGIKVRLQDGQIGRVQSVN